MNPKVPSSRQKHITQPSHPHPAQWWRRSRKVAPSRRSPRVSRLVLVQFMLGPSFPGEIAQVSGLSKLGILGKCSSPNMDKYLGPRPSIFSPKDGKNTWGKPPCLSVETEKAKVLPNTQMVEFHGKKTPRQTRREAKMPCYRPSYRSGSNSVNVG